MTENRPTTLKETSLRWADTFYDGSWKPDTIKDLTYTEKKFVESLTGILPRHMPVYDWNLPYAELILLEVRKFQKQSALNRIEEILGSCPFKHNPALTDCFHCIEIKHRTSELKKFVGLK